MDITNKSSPIPVNNYKRKSISEDKKYIPKDYIELAENMEGQFAKLMLEQMNNTIDRQEDLDSATNIYREMMIDEQAELLTKNDEGIGLQDMVLDQLYPQKFRNKANYNAYLEQLNHRNQLLQKTRNQRADMGNISMNNETNSARETK